MIHHRQRRGNVGRSHLHTKFFNEHLSPLRRFLDSNVGRPWDKVYSEICRHVDRGNVVQKHILTHLFDYVVVDTVLIDGEPCRGQLRTGATGTVNPSARVTAATGGTSARSRASCASHVRAAQLAEKPPSRRAP